MGGSSLTTVVTGSSENSQEWLYQKRDSWSWGPSKSVIKEYEPETLDSLFLSVSLLLDSTVTQGKKKKKKQ